MGVVIQCDYIENTQKPVLKKWPFNWFWNYMPGFTLRYELNLVKLSYFSKTVNKLFLNAAYWLIKGSLKKKRIHTLVYIY